MTNTDFGAAPAPSLTPARTLTKPEAAKAALDAWWIEHIALSAIAKAPALLREATAAKKALEEFLKFVDAAAE